MRSQSTESIIKPKAETLSSDSAWKLWKKLNELSDALWEAFESDFLGFCIEECDSIRPDKSYPFE